LVKIPNIGIISKYILGIFRVWAIPHNGLAVGDVALSLGYIRAPYCLLRVMGIYFYIIYHSKDQS
jgi:hypothetical protein